MIVNDCCKRIIYVANIKIWAKLPMELSSPHYICLPYSIRHRRTLSTKEFQLVGPMKKAFSALAIPYGTLSPPRGKAGPHSPSLSERFKNVVLWP